MEKHRKKPTEVKQLCYELSDQVFSLLGLHLDSPEKKCIWKLANIMVEFRDDGRKVRTT